MNPGDSLDGRYTIQERLGAGGMGEVYKATHTMLGSTRVIKIVRPQIAGNQDAQDRFIREARVSTKIHHPNVATLHDFASLPDGSHYMVWEYIDGENLAQRLRARGTLPPRQALRITIQALKGLDAIHRAGIVHRDISPENLMITHDDETVKIIDLGVAKIEDTEVAQTRTGIFVGKLRYAAPEQLGFLPENERIDGRADLYALAMVLVELLTGRPPYEAKSPHEYFILHAREVQTMTVELPRHLPGSAALQSVLDKALSRDRNQRYATARDFATALEEIERTLPEQRDLPTVATPLDGDETMRVRPTNADTLHRSTVRTNAPAESNDVTVQTPMPAPIAASAAPSPQASIPTLATDVPMQLPPPPPQPLMSAPPPPPMSAVPAPVKRSSSAPAIIAILIAVFLFLGVAAAGVYYAWPKIAGLMSGGPKTDTTATTSTAIATNTATTTTAPPQTASSVVDVTESPVLINETTATTATTSTAPVLTHTIAPVKPRRTETAPVDLANNNTSTSEDANVDEVEPSRIDRTWRPGRGRRSANWRLELAGTNTVSIRAGGDSDELARALKRNFPRVRFSPLADVVIKYDQRSSSGSVSKDGRVLYASEASTPEEFAQELADIFNGQ
ncbi:MAG: serine/threonine protein kinase [Thermoanaerobaculia bacterium]